MRTLRWAIGAVLLGGAARPGFELGATWGTTTSTEALESFGEGRPSSN